MRTQLAVVAFLAVAVALAAAQESGRLSGTVRDEGGNVLPGVIVMVDGPALDKARVSVTDAKGKFTFRSLPADDRYAVTFHLTQFRMVVRRNVSIAVDKEATSDAVMVLSPTNVPPGGFPWSGGIIPLSVR